MNSYLDFIKELYLRGVISESVYENSLKKVNKE